MPRVFISAGSNIRPAENMKLAVRGLARQMHILHISTVYRTEAVGLEGQPPFYNCIIELETSKLPAELKFGILRKIEEELGRKRGSDRNAPRTIDLDLILYGDLVMNDGQIEIPDPGITKRSFIAVPLSEIDPDLKIPGSGLRIGDTVSAMARTGMAALEAYTRELRKEMQDGFRQGKD